jgi:hypothetical protein
MLSWASSLPYVHSMPYLPCSSVLLPSSLSSGLHFFILWSPCHIIPQTINHAVLRIFVLYLQMFLSCIFIYFWACQAVDAATRAIRGYGLWVALMYAYSMAMYTVQYGDGRLRINIRNFLETLFQENITCQIS